MSADHEDTVALLQSLIRNACVNDGTPESGQEIRSVRTLERFFAGVDIDYRVIEPAPGRASLIARIVGSDPHAASVALLGHLDVVGVEDGWAHDPFGGEIVDGVVWGRGAVDMLGLTAAMAVVFRAIAREGVRLRGDLVFVAVADEEAGGGLGVGWIVANEPALLDVDYVITENGGIPLGVPGEPVRAVTVTVGEKARAPRRLTVRGRPGHGSVPWGADSAAAPAAELLARIFATAGEAQITEHWRGFVAAADLDADLKLRLVDPARVNGALGELGRLTGYAHAMTHLTVSPNVVRAGTKVNVIPGVATIDLDVRILPGQTAHDVDRHLAGLVGDLADRVSIEGDETGVPTVSAAGTPFYAALERAVQKHYPSAGLVPLIMPGGTDAAHLRPLGIDAYGFGLFSPEWDIATFRTLFHGNDERIDIESLRLTTTALDDALREFLL